MSLTDPSVPTQRSDSVLEALNASLKALDTTASSLASKEYVQAFHQAEAQRRKYLAYLVIAVGVCFLVMFAMVLFGLWQIGIAVDNAKQGNQQLVECTTPGTKGDVHECWDRNLKRTAELREQLAKDTADKVLEGLKNPR